MPTDQRFEDLNPDPNAQPAESLDRAGEHVNATGQCRNNDGSDPQILDGKERDCSPASESGASPVDGPIEGGININEVHGGNIHEEPGDGSNLPFGSNNALYGDGNADMIGNVNGSDDGNKSDESVDGTGDGDNSENGNGDGTGNGDGNGDGTGNGDGNGDGTGNGDGNGDGTAYGDSANGNQGGMPNPDDNGGNGPSGMPSDDDSGSGHHHPNSDDGMPDPDSNNPGGPNSNIAFVSQLSAGQSGEISHGFWEQAAAASGDSGSASSSTAKGLDLATAGHQSLGTSSELHSLMGLTDQGSHEPADNSTAGVHASDAQLAHIDTGDVHAQLDVTSHSTDFSHQMHI